MATTRSNISALLLPGIDEVYGMTISQWEKQFDKFCKMNSSNKSKEKYQQTYGFGNVPERTEGGTSQVQSIGVGYETEIVNKSYALATEVTEEALADEQYSQLGMIGQAFGQSYRDTVETLAAAPLNSAHDAGVTWSDGQSLLSTAHVFAPGEGTYSNTLAVDADLSFTSYDSLRVQVKNAVDVRSKKRKLMPETLIVTPNFERTAYEIMNSQLQPGTPNNDINFNAAHKVNVMVSNYVSTPDFWFLTVSDGTGRKALSYQTRQPERVQSEADFDRMSQKFRIAWRMNVGIVDPSLIYGSR